MSHPNFFGPTSLPSLEDLHRTLETMREEGWLTDVSGSPTVVKPIDPVVGEPAGGFE
ncbi:hypothetical protein ATK86_0983 [Nocardia fluminea]|uniref:Uncharacterized protein n=1 Tax=Nocardia fluminea TaxID=134984 RepID=A0A2N3WYN1_9NOCA|nr:hypothetical protein ATK86_0983 [Nocardia fluminea]